MTTTEKMNLDERHKYLRIMRQQYRQAQTRRAKQELLDQMETITGLHRKYLIQLMRPEALKRQPRQQERGPEYGPDVDAALAVIWEAQDYICAERLQPVLVFTAEQLTKHSELQLGPRLREQLGTIHPSTIRRHLPPRPTPRAVPPRKRPEHASQAQIPIRRIPWDTAEPGHCELDLVHHCGLRTVGEYGYTLQLVDVATGWSARRAILGRSYIVVADALYYLFQQLPFPILEVHPDSGGEFLNDLLWRFLRAHYPELDASRSKPGHPNDNRFVEQKNDTLVRAFLGDVRLDTVTQIRYLNHIYERMHVYYNYLQPVMHQIDKEWVPNPNGTGGYTRRQHDLAAPPLVRLCQTATLPATTCAALLEQRAALNPLALRREIYAALRHLFTYPGAVPGLPENVYETLAQPELFPAAIAALQAGETVDNPEAALPTVPPAATTTPRSPSQKGGRSGG